MLRLCLALFLLIPTPVFANEVPGEVTVNEGFEDSTYETILLDEDWDMLSHDDLP